MRSKLSEANLFVCGRLLKLSIMCSIGQKIHRGASWSSNAIRRVNYTIDKTMYYI